MVRPLGQAHVCWQTALRVSDYRDEEDRAANEWLAGNNAGRNQNDLVLHDAMIDHWSQGKQAENKKGGPEGPPIALEAIETTI